MTLRLRTMLLAFAMLTLTAVNARAAEQARLVFLRGQGTESCPDEQVLKDAVAARLGYDPFSRGSLETLFAELERDGPAFVARIKLVTFENVVRGARVLRTTSTCDALVPSLALTISLAIDPMSAMRTGPPEDLPPAERLVTIEEPRAEEPPPVPPPVAPPEPTPEPRFPLTFAAGLGVLGSVGTAPGVALGGLLFGRVRRRDLSLGLEARGDLPASADGERGRVSSFLLAGSLLPCAHTGAFFACGRASAGALVASGLDVARPGRSTVPWLEVGGRLGYELPLGDRLALRFHIDAGVVLLRYSLRVEGERVFEHPPVHGGAGIALAVNLP